MDALIVALTLALRRRKARKVLCAVALLAVAAVATAYAVMPKWAKVVTAVTLAPAMAFAAHKHKNFADYFTTLALLAGLTFALGGAVYGASYLVGVDLRGYLVLAFVAAAGIVAVICVKAFAAARGKAFRRIERAVIDVGGVKMNADALCDSGNTLTDIASGLPVMIVSGDFAARLRSEAGVRVEGYVEAATVGGQLSLPIVGINSVTVCGRTLKAYAALSESKFDGYEIVLQNTMFDEVRKNARLPRVRREKNENKRNSA